ncbi:DUF3104 domain-containing protein [Synechococcus sp. RS9902]
MDRGSRTRSDRRWRQKSQAPNLFQVADVDISVINLINADLVTHSAPRV